ncbi:MAG: cysteine-rich CWC family protein [Acidobacteria bacterium]|nr:cysteine-rich CWC family protein [Acidobacteriota bacterium]
MANTSMRKKKSEPERVSAEAGQTSRCESCGKPFTCGFSLRGCWCSEVKLSDAARANLRARYRNCLCHECLQLYADAIEASSPSNS